MEIPTIDMAEPIEQAGLPSVRGCYVIFVRPYATDDLGSVKVSKSHVLYVGKAEESIRKRVQGSHLLDGRNGSSTLRRSLAAILRERLLLVPVPRSDDEIGNKRFTNYGLDASSDVRLSEWIRTNLLVAGVPSTTPKRTEGELISRLCPPLCLNGWENPQRSQIRALRKQCSELAKRGAPVA